MTTATKEAVEQGIRHAQERYQSAIDLHEYVNPHHITHSVESHCEHELFSMRCYGDGRTECGFAVALVCVTTPTKHRAGLWDVTGLRLPISAGKRFTVR